MQKDFIIELLHISRSVFDGTVYFTVLFSKIKKSGQPKFKESKAATLFLLLH